MKYNVIKAEVLVIEAGKENAGEKYVKLVIEPQDIFDPKVHTVCMFVPQATIPAWEERVKDLSKLPVFNGTEEVVENLPPFNFKDSRTGELIQPARTSLSVFVRINADGKPADDPRSVATRTIKQLGKFVETDSAPIAPPADATPVAAVPPTI